MMNDIESDNKNTSGMGKYAHVPHSLSRDYNVGAFCLNFFWLIYYKQYFFALVFFLCFALFLISQLRLFMLIIFFGIAIAVGRFGNVWAWRARRYKSVSDFNVTHRKIAIFGAIYFIIFGFLILKNIHIDTNLLLMLESPSTYYANQSINGEYNTNSNVNKNPIRQIGDIHNQVAKTEYDVALNKAILYLNSAFSLDFMNNGEISESITGDKLAEIVRMHTSDVIYYNGNVIKKSDGSILQFVADKGDCSKLSCYVLIDINGLEKGPNKYPKNKDEIVDRIKIYIKKNSQGMLFVEGIQQL